MANKIYHWTSNFKTLGESEDGGVEIKGSASTNSLDRAGDIINADAWTKGGLENFKNNPKPNNIIEEMVYVMLEGKPK